MWPGGAGTGGTRPRGTSLPFRAPGELRAPQLPNNGPEAWVPSTVPSANPAILLPGRTLPPFLATPDPISAVYSELGAGLATGLKQSFPCEPLPLFSLSVGSGGEQVHGVALSSPDQVETMANATLSLGCFRLVKVIYHLAEQPRLARLRRAEPPWESLS